MIRVACYYRVSKDKKGGVSIDIQRETCERFIAHQAGWLVVATYIDDGKSAYTDDLSKRPAFQQLLRDSAARQFDVLLVYKFDRFARKRRVYFQYIDELKEHYRIDVKSATESDDWLSVGFNGLMAEQYSRMLSARMTDVRRWEVTQCGLHVGRVPVGYTRARGLLIPSEDAEAVRLLGRLYATGHYSHVRLAEHMNAEGYTMPNSQPWKSSAIKEILRSPIYAGYLVYRGEVFPGAHTPLWDTDLWTQIQAVWRQRSYSRSPEAPHYALLTGLVRCAMCGNAMSHMPVQRIGQRYYRCQAATRRMLSPLGLTCRARCAYAELLESAILDWLSGLSLVPSLVERVRAALMLPPRQSGPSRADLEERLRRLARAYADGGYSDEEYVVRRTDLLDQLERVAEVAPRIDIEMALTLLADLPALLKEATPQERQQIVRQFIAEVYVFRRDVRAIRPTRAGELFLQAVDPEEWLTIVQNNVRSASDADHHIRLKLPVILAAA